MDTVYKLSSGTLAILTGDAKYIGLFVRGMTGESGEQTGMGTGQDLDDADGRRHMSDVSQLKDARSLARLLYGSRH